MESFLMAVGVYALLGVGAGWFNRQIDESPRHERPDGITALWVVMGVGGTLAGALVLMGLAWPMLDSLAERFGDWAGAGGAFVLVVSAFMASGLPMIVGDAHRSAVVRRSEAGLAEARACLRGEIG